MTEFSKEETPTRPDAPQSLRPAQAAETERAERTANEPAETGVRLGRNTYIPTAVIVAVATLLANGGATAGCSRQDEIIRKLDTIEKKVDGLDRDGRALDRRLSRLEGARGAPGSANQ